jgi:hypothetical protein
VILALETSCFTERLSTLKTHCLSEERDHARVACGVWSNRSEEPGTGVFFVSIAAIVVQIAAAAVRAMNAAWEPLGRRSTAAETPIRTPAAESLQFRWPVRGRNAAALPPAFW